MKVSKMFTIDHELATLLSRENNASALVNSLLTDYYDANSSEMEKKNPRAEAETTGNTSKDEENQGESAKTA